MSHFTLNDLPAEEKPRERLQQHGADALSIQELLALVLGRGVHGEPVMVIAQRLLSQFGSLEGIANASFEDLCQIKGLGVAKASQLLACFEMSIRINSPLKVNHPIIGLPEDMAELLINKLGKYTKEHFVMVSLNTRTKILGIDTISIGTLNSSIVHPRETFEPAIRRHAAKIIISHNHPSGHPDPSDADQISTDQLVSAGKILGIELIDHIIVTKNSYLSFKEQGLL